MEPIALTTPRSMAECEPVRSASFRAENSLTRGSADGNVVCRSNPQTEEAPRRGQHQVRHQADEAERAASTAQPCGAERHPLLAEGGAHCLVWQIAGLQGDRSRSHPY